VVVDIGIIEIFGMITVEYLSSNSSYMTLKVDRDPGDSFNFSS